MARQPVLGRRSGLRQGRIFGGRSACWPRCSRIGAAVGGNPARDSGDRYADTYFCDEWLTSDGPHGDPTIRPGAQSLEFDQRLGRAEGSSPWLVSHSSQK